MKVHPLCDAIPEMQADEFAGLLASIRENGYDATEPVIVFEGMILDGRHRWRANRELKKAPPPTREFKGTAEEAIEFVRRRSVCRRNLSASQRAMIAAALEPFYAEAAKARQEATRARPGTQIGKAPARLPPPMAGHARDRAAKAVGVSSRYVSDAKQITQAAPAVAERVKRGELSIPEAKKAIRTPPPPARTAGVSTPAQRKDELGRPVTDDGVAEALDSVSRFDEVVNALHSLNRQVRTLAGEKVGRHLRSQQIEASFKNIIAAVKFATPYTSCPNLPNCKHGCKACDGARWVTKEIWDRIPAEERA